MEEKKKILEELENRQFMLQMKDHWSRDDYVLDSKLSKQISELRNEVGNE